MGFYYGSAAGDSGALVDIRATGLYGDTGATEEMSSAGGHPRAEKGEQFPSLCLILSHQRLSGQPQAAAPEKRA